MTYVGQVWHKLAWLFVAAGVAFAVPAIFSMGLCWERTFFLFPYISSICLLLVFYFKNHRVSLRQSVGTWPYACIGTAIASFLLLRSIDSQPPSAVQEGWQLAIAVAWIGVAYGVVDGLLLNVFPVLIVQGASFFESGPSLRSRLTSGSLALLASLVITVVYHLGYTEFQGVAVIYPVIGNAIITLTYLLTGSPVAAVMAHAILHTAAVFHGMETTLQLPPHYL